MKWENINNGDYVDFGEHGKLYVIYSRDEDTFWVTDNIDDRFNRNASGWIIKKKCAIKIIEEEGF
jgi:hypothetical protein